MDPEGERTGRYRLQEQMLFMDHYVEGKYSNPDTRIDQQGARQDSLLYVATELGHLTLTPSRSGVDPNELELIESTIDAINQAVADASHGDWSAMKSYFQEIAGMSSGDAEADQTRVKSFMRLANLI